MINLPCFLLFIELWMLIFSSHINFFDKITYCKRLLICILKDSLTKVAGMARRGRRPVKCWELQLPGVLWTQPGNLLMTLQQGDIKWAFTLKDLRSSMYISMSVDMYYNWSHWEIGSCLDSRFKWFEIAGL